MFFFFFVSELTYAEIVYQNDESIYTMNLPKDEDLIDLLKEPATREKGFLMLMERYKEPVYWHIRRMVGIHHDAEDLVQETFIKVYRHAGSFKGESKVFTWLYRIATNECNRHFRRNKHRLGQKEMLTDRFTSDRPETDPDPAEVILEKFQKAILNLPPKQRAVFTMRYYDELGYEELGPILNSSVNALKTNYHLANEKIKKYMAEQA